MEEVLKMRVRRRVGVNIWEVVRRVNRIEPSITLDMKDEKMVPRGRDDEEEEEDRAGVQKNTNKYIEPVLS
jgi:hypothetical protein